MINVATDILDKLVSGKSEKTMLMELLDRMGKDKWDAPMGHARIKIFHVWSIPHWAAVAANRNLKEKTLTNVFRQLLDVNIWCALEAVCCNQYLRLSWIRGELKIDELGEYCGAVGTGWRKTIEMHPTRKNREGLTRCIQGSADLWTMVYILPSRVWSGVELSTEKFEGGNNDQCCNGYLGQIGIREELMISDVREEGKKMEKDLWDAFKD